MLNISRIESGRFTIEPVPTDMDKLVLGVVTEMQTRATEVGRNLLYDPPHMPLVVKADVGRIKEVLINLIGNSLKFTPKDGSVTVLVEKNEQDFAVTKVKDTGRGISKENMYKLFKNLIWLEMHISQKTEVREPDLVFIFPNLLLNYTEAEYGRSQKEKERAQPFHSLFLRG